MVLTVILSILILITCAGVVAIGVVHFRPRIGFLEPLYAWLAERDGTLVAPPVPVAAAGPAPAPPPMPAPPAAAPRRFTAPADVVAGGPPPAGGSAAQGDVLSMIGALVAEASHGDMRNARRVVATLAAVYDAAGRGTVHIGTRMAEPDKDYGAEIWEPIVAAGHQGSAAAMRLAVADANLASLGRMTVDEVAHSTRRAPNNRELNGAA